MKASGRLLIAVALLISTVRGAERDIVRTFKAESGTTLSIDSYRGAINITESDEPVIRVAVHLEIGATSEAVAERMLQTLQLDFDTNGRSIRVIARRPAEQNARFVWNENEQIEPTYRVTVPRQCNLDLKTINGGIIVGNITGRLAAHTGKGDIFFRHVGGSVDAATETGDVIVSQCNGSVQIHVQHGTIRLGVVTGRCDLYDSSGDVEVMNAKNGVHAYAEAGSATISLPRDFEGDTQITTSGGNITLRLDPAAKCELKATTSLFGHIEDKLHIAGGSSGRRILVGRLNQGGSSVVLYASGGVIKLEAGESPFESQASEGGSE